MNGKYETKEEQNTFVYFDPKVLVSGKTHNVAIGGYDYDNINWDWDNRI